MLGRVPTAEISIHPQPPIDKIMEMCYSTGGNVRNPKNREMPSCANNGAFSLKKKKIRLPMTNLAKNKPSASRKNSAEALLGYADKVQKDLK